MTVAEAPGAPSPPRKVLPTLQRSRSPLADPAHQLARLHAVPLRREFDEATRAAGVPPLTTAEPEVLQVNVGRVCNQTCRHCHVDAGPDRRESMGRDVFEACLRLLRESSIATVDITGGAPEMNPHFRWFVEECRALGRHVIDRCNLTILQTRAHGDLPAFFARHDVEVVASLPHPRGRNTDRQRGEGVFSASIAAMKALNDHGYGHGDPRRRLVLVTNPVGAFLPGDQATMEREWKTELARRHAVAFDALYTITNMPISRYLEWLESSGNLDTYLQQLVAAFNPAAVEGLMCRTTLSVGWDGRVFDCDFNQMLELPAHGPAHIRDLAAERLAGRPIRVDRHCFGCTAGAGSSCGGTTA